MVAHGCRVFDLKRVVLLIGALLALPGTAPASTLEDCTQQDDWWLRVQACTAAIDSGQYEGRRASWAYSNRAVAYAALGNYIGAFDDHERAVKLDPANARARNNKGNSHADFREYDRALREYTRAIELSPGYTNAHFNRAGVHLAVSAYAEAVDDYSIVISDAPDFGDAYAGRAEAQCQLGLVDEAVTDRLTAIRLEVLPRGEVASYLQETGYLIAPGDDVPQDTGSDASAAGSDEFTRALTNWTQAGCP